MRPTLTLGYDDHCSKCTGIAQGVERASDGMLQILPLRSAEFQELAGTGIREKPTLLVREGARVRRFDGLALGFAMARYLGVPRAWRVASGLWRVRSGASEPPEGISRGTFISGVLGMTFGLWVLGSAGASASRGDISALRTDVDSRDWLSRFQEPESREAMSDDEARQRWDALQVSAGVMGVTTLPEFRALAGDRANAMRQNPSQLFGVVQTAKNGDRLEAVASQDGDLAVVQYNYVVDGRAGNETLAYRFDEDEDVYLLVGAHDGRDGVALASACPSRCTSSQCSYNPCEFCGYRCCRSDRVCVLNCCVPCFFSCSTPVPCLACSLVWCPACVIMSRCCQAQQSWCWNSCT